MKSLSKKSFLVGVLLFSTCIVNAETLQDVVTHTIKANPDVLANVKGWLASEQAVKGAIGGYLPRVDVNAYVGEERTKNSSTDFDYNSLTTSGAGITLRQLVFDGFATSSEVARTRHHATAERYRVEGVTNDTALLTAKAYLDVITTQQILDLAQINYQNHRKIYDMIQDRAKSGLDRQADVNQAKGRVAFAKTNFLAARNNYLDARVTYYKIVGLMPQKLDYPNAPKNDCLPGDESSATRSAIYNHPLLKLAQADVDEAKAQHRAAISPNYPQVDALLNASTDKNIDGVEGNFGKQSVMLELSYNLFKGGSDLSKQKETAFYTQQAEQIRDRTYDQVVENMRLSWNAFITARDQIIYFKQHREASILTTDAYYKQFEVNKRTLLDLLNAEDELFNSKVDYLKGQSNLMVSKFRVLNAEGKLLDYLGVPSHYSRSTAKTKVIFEKNNQVTKPSNPKIVDSKNSKPIPPAAPKILASKAK